MARGIGTSSAARASPQPAFRQTANGEERREQPENDSRRDGNCRGPEQHGRLYVDAVELCKSKGTQRAEEAQASPNPSRPPARDRTRLSVRSWRAKRNRPAPSAVRTANSRWRPQALTRSRFATLAQAMSRTTPTAAKRSRSPRW